MWEGAMWENGDWEMDSKVSTDISYRNVRCISDGPKYTHSKAALVIFGSSNCRSILSPCQSSAGTSTLALPLPLYDDFGVAVASEKPPRKRELKKPTFGVKGNVRKELGDLLD